MKKKLIVLFLLIAAISIFLFIGTASARLRVVIGPWWPRAVVVVPVVPAPAPVPPPPGNPYGYVDINIHPAEAGIYVDDEYRGTADDFDGTPSYLTLVEGKHKITFRKKGYSSVSFVVNVVAGQVVTLDITMEEAKEAAPSEEKVYQLDMEGTGNIEFDVKPADAVIYIDGSFYGVASQFKEGLESIVLKSGSHHIEILKPGHVTYTSHIIVERGGKKTIKVNLEKKE